MELDGLVRGRAVFFADDAWNSLGIRQTTVLVKKDIAYLGCMFFFHGEFGQGAGGTYLTTKGAVEFTVAGSGIEAGREHAFKTGGQEGWLQAITDTYLHTLAAADAAAEK